MKKLIIALLLSLAAVGCSKTYPTTFVTVQDTTRNDNGIKNPVTIFITYSPTSNLQIFTNGSIAFTGTSFFVPDSLVVPDSARLFAKWYSGNTAIYTDTIATANLHWNIH